VELAGQLGGGTNPVGGQTDPLGIRVADPIGFGFGGRGGVTFSGFYLGLNGMYYVGSNRTGTLGNGSYAASGHSVLYGLEAGYGVTLCCGITIRPQLGVGADRIYQDEAACAPAPCSAANTNAGGGNGTPYLQPGLVGLMSFGLLVVGADVNALLLPWAPWTSNNSFTVVLTVHGQVGVAF
jgi:hypothetical protein